MFSTQGPLRVTWRKTPSLITFSWWQTRSVSGWSSNCATDLDSFSGNHRSSWSRKATRSASAARIPVLRAPAIFLFSCRMQRPRSLSFSRQRSPLSRVASVEPSSTTMTS